MPADSRDMVLVPRSWLESFDREANPNEAIADNGGSVWDFFCHEAGRFLSASPARGEGDAPVAWRVVSPSGEEHGLFYHHGEAKANAQPGDTVKPLYGHPTPATPEGLREALGRAVVFDAYSAADPLALRFEFQTEEDRLAAANAVDAALQPQAEGE